MNQKQLHTVMREGDGTWLQTYPYIEEDEDMKLKCNLCVERHGNAVKTDQLVIVTIKGRDYMACIKCANQVKGGTSHDNSNTESRGRSTGIPL